MQLLSKQDENERGYDLEKLLNEAFALFELAPHSPFKRVGEQIDGAFVLDKEHFLLEAKWHKQRSNLAHLRDLDGAVSSSLDNTLGLFLAVAGFTEEALSGYLAGNRPRMICMDGGDLMLVLDGRIDLPELLFRKKEIAAQRRRIFVSANDIIFPLNERTTKAVGGSSTSISPGFVSSFCCKGLWAVFAGGWAFCVRPPECGNRPRALCWFPNWNLWGKGRRGYG